MTAAGDWWIPVLSRSRIPVTQSQVANLPVLDRQINNLFYTQPGVNFNGSANTAINGLRAQNTNVTLDGVNIQDNFIRISGLDFLPTSSPSARSRRSPFPLPT